jgi:hypothetical protein
MRTESSHNSGVWASVGEANDVDSRTRKTSQDYLFMYWFYVE